MRYKDTDKVWIINPSNGEKKKIRFYSYKNNPHLKGWKVREDMIEDSKELPEAPSDVIESKASEAQELPVDTTCEDQATDTQDVPVDTINIDELSLNKLKEVDLTGYNIPELIEQENQGLKRKSVIAYLQKQ